MYIGYKDKVIFIPKEASTLEEVISTLLEGTINMFHCLFSEDKTFLLMLIMDLYERKDIFSTPVVCEFLDVFLEDVTFLPPRRGGELSIDLVSGTTPVSLYLTGCLW